MDRDAPAAVKRGLVRVELSDRAAEDIRRRIARDRSKGHPFERLVRPAVVELRRPRAGVTRHRRRPSGTP